MESNCGYNKKLLFSPCVQHIPSLAHLPLCLLQNELPAMQGSRSWNIPSRWHLKVSWVPKWQPNGPQQILGPKHCPLCPGPQDMHYIWNKNFKKFVVSLAILPVLCCCPQVRISHFFSPLSGSWWWDNRKPKVHSKARAVLLLRYIVPFRLSMCEQKTTPLCFYTCFSAFTHPRAPLPQPREF